MGIVCAFVLIFGWNSTPEPHVDMIHQFTVLQK